jgi:putative oxidoreductase
MNHFWSLFRACDFKHVSSLLQPRTLVQRIFSTFPNAWPGRGLALLRLTLATPLLQESISFICGMTHSPPLLVDLLSLVAAGLLLLGLWTPIGAGLQVVLEVWSATQAVRYINEHALLAAVGAALIMLGPGAWSIDAKLFGRRRIDLGGA